MRAKNVFVAATGQNVGKTTNCLGLFDRLRSRDFHVGFIKPVGQRYVRRQGSMIDEDSWLIHQTYKPGCELQDMNPVSVPSGFTREHIDGGDRNRIHREIMGAYERIEADRDFVLIEGTGHAGVGSVFETSNADVARMLGSKVVLVTDGGIGRAIDQLNLNKALFDAVGVPVVGVILNKVFQDKYDEVSDYVRRGLDRIGLPLLGVLPFRPALGAPSITQVKDVLKAEYLAGEDHAQDYAENAIVGAMSVAHFLSHIKRKTLVITPGDREDIILAALSWNLADANRQKRISCLVVTGDHKPGRFVTQVVRKSNVPVLMTKLDTFQTASQVHDLLVKIQVTDKAKIKLSQQLCRENVDIDELLQRCE